MKCLASNTANDPKLSIELAERYQYGTAALKAGNHTEVMSVVNVLGIANSVLSVEFGTWS